MNVAILGCGPSGLIAAHAAASLGNAVVIYSVPRKSDINGAMFMHDSIPGVNNIEPEFQIDIIKSGVREGYAENVYGDPHHPVSWDKFKQGPFPAWDLRSAYYKLWDRWSGRIISCEITPKILGQIVTSHELVISTIPANVICTRPDIHQFKYQNIWVKRMFSVGQRNLMHYNGWTTDGKYGEVGPAWYRFSQIRSLRSWEYAKPIEGQNIIRGYKPLETNCNCWPRVMRVGRFGAWHRQILTHHVWKEVISALQPL